MQKAYYAIIPAGVRYCKDLTDGAKLLYGEITALCNEKGFCWATNSYFAELYGKSNDTISRWIGELSAFGFITTAVEKENGNIRKIWLANEIPIGKNTDRVSAKMQIGYRQKCSDPIGKNAEHNNTVNSTGNNIEEEKDASLFSSTPSKVFPLEAEKKERGLQKPAPRLAPPFTRVGEIHQPDAMVKMYDPKEPGVTLVEPVTFDYQKSEPTVRPAKTGREKKTGREPEIHPENETAFQHFTDPAKARESWAAWIKYKHEQHGERYKSKDSELIKLRQLWTDSAHNSDTAAKMIENAIGNLWKGIFKLKEEKQNGQGQLANITPTQRQHLNLAATVAKWQQLADMERTGSFREMDGTF